MRATATMMVRRRNAARSVILADDRHEKEYGQVPVKANTRARMATVATPSAAAASGSSVLWFHKDGTKTAKIDS